MSNNKWLHLAAIEKRKIIPQLSRNKFNNKMKATNSGKEIIGGAGAGRAGRGAFDA